jgi:REP element-mobilizing transposase RayT
MTIKPTSHHRRSIRLPGYDYSQPGAYFITICTHQREHLFGEIVNGVINLNEFGLITREEWQKTALIRIEFELGEFVIMPNHVHGIIMIHESVGAYGNTPVGAYSRTPLLTFNPATFYSPSRTIGAMVRGYKSAVTTRINQKRDTPRMPVWQRNYWEHIIRDEQDLSNAHAYILNNPAQWETDQLYSRGIS